MAIIQISRIQHRRGLQQDLPNLAAAELGWSVDSQKLYIGNGTLAEGAPVEGRTEILTQNSDLFGLVDQYQFKALPAGSVANTSGDGEGFRRTLQEKLDDFVNVRDFGAFGDGQTDDTEALQRAVRYMISYQTTIQGVEMHRKLYFPAGVYKVSDTIYVPPFIQLCGDGNQITVIRMSDAVTSPVIRFTDNNGGYGGNLGNDVSGTQPEAKGYIFSDICIENTGNNESCMIIDGGSDFFFSRCRFKGKASSTSGSAVTMTALTPVIRLETKRVFFDQCEFSDHNYGVETSYIELSRKVDGVDTDVPTTVDGVIFNECVFSSLRKDTQFSAYTTGVVIKTPQTSDSETTLVDRYGSRNVRIGLSKDLTAGTDSLLISANDYDNLVLDYVIAFDTNEKRNGKLTVSGNGSNYFSQDDYVESLSLPAASDITLKVDTDGNIVYTSGVDFKIHYTASFYN